MSACSSGTLTNVQPHRNAMPQTQDMTPHPELIFHLTVDLFKLGHVHLKVCFKKIEHYFNHAKCFTCDTKFKTGMESSIYDNLVLFSLTTLPQASHTKQ